MIGRSLADADFSDLKIVHLVQLTLHETISFGPERRDLVLVVFRAESGL